MKRAARVMLLVVCFSLIFATSVVAGKSGIWKPADGSNNFYIQTYSTGSCVVIVTPDGEDFYVFLDPECDGTIAASEYFGRSASLDLTFTSDDTATADLVIGGNHIPYSLSRLFEGDCRDGGNGNGTITNSLGMTFVYISPGKFTMGSPDSEAGRFNNEIQHQVTLTQGYYMQTTEITQGQWKAVMETNPSSFSECGDSCPVENVSWNDVQTFINILNARGEGMCRLPTEAEWEYACRAGSTTAFANGGISELECGLDPNLDAMGWYCGNSGNSTHPVAQKEPNGWGLYDMHGNVWEWCEDWYDSYPSAPVTDPAGPASGSSRVNRGGWGARNARYCRSAFRGGDTPDYRDYSLGFRLVMVAP